jgi:hypothetical protein
MQPNVGHPRHFTAGLPPIPVVNDYPHRPGGARDLVGQRDSGDLRRAARQKLGQPRPARVADLLSPPDPLRSPARR